jgi:ribonucleotide reductase beta subunit family protein with ferritin-like domain
MDDFDFSQFPKACTLIAEHEIDIELKHLQTIEYAEHNLATACIELFYNFRDGANGFPCHYELTRYYANKLIEIAYADKTENRELMMFDIHKLAGLMEGKFGNYYLAAQELEMAVRIMNEKLPEEKWDEQILNILEEYRNYE